VTIRTSATSALADPTIGVDVGGTNVRAALVDDAGVVVADAREATPLGGESIVEAIGSAVARLGAEHPTTAVGVGIAALVSYDGVAHYAPNIATLQDTAVRELLERNLDVPVVVDNDANMAAYGEAAYGAARGLRDALVITLGTGVGGGVLVDGKMLRGARGIAAEVGHFQIDPAGPPCACGERGHWESFGSGTALGRMGRDAATVGSAPDVLAMAGGDVAKITGELVGDAAQKGSHDALGIVREYADYVAIGLAGLANIFDPQAIVIGGGLIELGDVLLEPVRASFGPRIEGPDSRPTIPIVPAALGEPAGVIGAAVRARPLVR